MAESEASNWTEDESSRDYFEDDTEDERVETSSEVTGKTFQDSIEDYEADEEDGYSRIELIGTIALSIFSTVLFAVFVLFAAVTSEDYVGVSWVLFFSLNAAIPFIFLVYWACCLPIFVIHLLAMINGMWSIMYLLMAAMQGQDEGTTMKDLSVPDTTSGVLMGQNSIIAMASIGFFSSMYHSLMAEHFFNSKKTESKRKKAKKVSVAMEARKKIERKRRRTQDLR